MPAFRKHMDWPSTQTSTVALHQGLTVNGFNAGAALSALLFGSHLVDVKGRRPALILGSALFSIGGAVQAASSGPVMLIFGRLVAGIGVGLTSSAGTAYIAEVAPAHSRGAMVGVYQNNICIAIVVAALLNWFVKDWENGWRCSLGLQLLAGAGCTVGLFFVPETPRFLAKAGRETEAMGVLLEIRGDEAIAQAELDGVLAELARESQAGIYLLDFQLLLYQLPAAIAVSTDTWLSGGRGCRCSICIYIGEATWSEIFRQNSSFRNVVLLGCGVQFAQIITGINALVSFSGTMFRQLGVAGITASLLPFVAFLLGNMIGAHV